MECLMPQSGLFTPAERSCPWIYISAHEGFYFYIEEEGWCEVGCAVALKYVIVVSFSPFAAERERVSGLCSFCNRLNHLTEPIKLN